MHKLREPSRSRRASSLAPRSYRPRKLQPALDSTKKLGSVSFLILSLVLWRQQASFCKRGVLLAAKPRRSMVIIMLTQSICEQASKLHPKQSMVVTSTRSAHLPETSASVAESSSKSRLRGLSVAAFVGYRSCDFVFCFFSFH